MAAFRIRRLPALFAAAVTAATMTAAVAQDRCEGTLCDLYYEHAAKPSTVPAPQPGQAAPPTRAQPAQAGDGVLSRLFGGGAPPQPAEAAAPARKPMVAVQGDGVVGLLQGRAPSRCTGTLCDFYYGGPPPEEPAARGPAAAEAPAREAEAGIDAPVAASRGFEPRESVARCAANPRDPWACYR